MSVTYVTRGAVVDCGQVFVDREQLEGNVMKREPAEVRLARARAYRRFADELLAEQLLEEKQEKAETPPQPAFGVDEWCRMNERRARR